MCAPRPAHWVRRATPSPTSGSIPATQSPCKAAGCGRALLAIRLTRPRPDEPDWAGPGRIGRVVSDCDGAVRPAQRVSVYRWGGVELWLSPTMRGGAWGPCWHSQHGPFLATWIEGSQCGPVTSTSTAIPPASLAMSLRLVWGMGSFASGHGTSAPCKRRVSVPYSRHETGRSTHYYDTFQHPCIKA